MELRGLAYFVAIVEEGSISAAAKQLHISQPPLSAQLRHLEEELGVTLIERGARHVTPTAAGRALYERAKRLLLLADAARQEVSQIAGGVRGVVRLGTISSCGPALLTPAFAAFCAQHPALRFEVREGNTYQLLDLLRAGAIELAVLRTPFTDEGLTCHSLTQEPLCAVGLPGLLGTGGVSDEAITLQALAGLPLVYYRRFELLLQGEFRRAGLPLQPFCVVDDARTALGWAAAGVAVALAPQRAAAEFCQGTALILRPLDAAGLFTRITVAARRSAPQSAAAKALTAVLCGNTCQ